MTDTEFTPEQTKALETIEKLLRLAAKNTSPEEAASAAVKAQDLLIAYNLSADSIGKAGASADAQREQKAIRGGMYQYQRDLWSAISRLNFCMYWTIEHHFERTIRRRDRYSGLMKDVIVDGKEFRHTVIGKRINVKATMMMADYLQSAIERLVKERYPANSQRFLSEAVAYREGMADELYNRLNDKRQQRIADEERRVADELARAGVSTSQALTLGSLTQQEEDANNDFRVGVPGWTAKNRAERAEAARQRAEAERAYAEWAVANPEEARQQEKEAEARRKKSGQRYSGGTGSRGGMTGSEKRMGSSSYWQGRDAGKAIGLDPQTNAAAKPKVLK